MTFGKHCSEISQCVSLDNGHCPKLFRAQLSFHHLAAKQCGLIQKLPVPGNQRLIGQHRSSVACLARSLARVMFHFPLTYRSSWSYSGERAFEGPDGAKSCCPALKPPAADRCGRSCCGMAWRERVRRPGPILACSGVLGGWPPKRERRWTPSQPQLRRLNGTRRPLNSMRGIHLRRFGAPPFRFRECHQVPIHQDQLDRLFGIFHGAPPPAQYVGAAVIGDQNAEAAIIRPVSPRICGSDGLRSRHRWQRVSERRRQGDATVLPLTPHGVRSQFMAQLSDAPKHSTFAAAAAQALADAERVRANSEQHLINSECHATRVALSRDKESWRAYWREQGKVPEPFVPYFT